ncbi:MAG: hypothetical protein CMJ25_16995 [Phycisphaerae bacterium]|nr:hypothetical protein [Phycisphaerae bacterium]
MINYKIEGFEGVMLEIQSLDDKMKRSEILKILRRQMQPVLDKMKQNAPNQRTEKINVRGTDINPQELKNSLAIKTSPAKKYPNVLVGPRYGKGKKKFDGFYAWWIEYGVGTHSANPTGKKNFIQKTYSETSDKIYTEASDKLKKYIKRKAKKLNL